MTGDWITATPGNSSPVERERDAMIERAILRDGRPLDTLGIVAEQTGARWKIEVLGRDELLERLDARARITSSLDGGKMVKEIAAWIRGLPRGVCPQLFRWDNGDGTWSYQRGTIERERRERSPRRPQPKIGRERKAGAP